MKKRAKKLHLSRETLRRLEPRLLRAAAGGTAETLQVTCLCSEGFTQCGEITCGPCAHTVVDCPGGEPG